MQIGARLLQWHERMAATMLSKSCWLELAKEHLNTEIEKLQQRAQEHQAQSSLFGGIFVLLPIDSPVEDDEDSEGSPPPLCDSSDDEIIDGLVNTADDETDEDDDTGG